MQTLNECENIIIAQPISKLLASVPVIYQAKLLIEA